MQWVQPIERASEASLNHPPTIQPGLVTPIPSAVEVRPDGAVEAVDQIEVSATGHSMSNPGETEYADERRPRRNRHATQRDSGGWIRPGVGKQVYRVSGAGHGGDERGKIPFRTPGGSVPLADESDPHVGRFLGPTGSGIVGAIARTSPTVMAWAHIG